MQTSLPALRLFFPAVIGLLLVAGCGKTTVMINHFDGGAALPDGGIRSGDTAVTVEAGDTESAPADLAPADLAPADLAPADLAPADLAPADLASADRRDLAPPADAETCDGSAMNGIWRRASDGLVMVLATSGCTVLGTADNAAYTHAITGTFDRGARTVQGTIKRTRIGTGCATVMIATLQLSDPTHFTLTITGTDGLCDLPMRFTEVSGWEKL